MKTEALSAALLDELGRLSTCVIDSAIETFGVRLRNSGFADSRVRCVFQDRPPMAGYAVTARIRSSEPPMESHSYYDRTPFWNHLETVPGPRVVVIQDIDHRPGLGAFVGAVHANILRALGCVGLVTDGGVRDLDEIECTKLQMFAGNVSVSHAYAHLFDFGGSVEVGGMKVKPGDLIHGDRHGVQTIPREIADQVPAKAREILECRKRIIGVCQSPDFSLERLRAAIQEGKELK
jgi:4-hydroxy-4-methyl-2-oxoglutarate aldolase